MTLDQLIAALQLARTSDSIGAGPVVIVTKSGAIKPLSGKVVDDIRLEAIVIKTVN